ncbi:MFS transporter [Mucilaginibacter sp.]|uniref:MFS transporter n=1 Tax=Mucilaginibacter sp. TaxID=1882438 RepID=UPI003D133B96
MSEESLVNGEVKEEEEKVSYRFMLPLVLGTMMNPLNSTMLATALITLCNSFKISIGSGAILITSLYVTSTVAQPLMGRLADIFSPKKINTLGFVLVFIAALIGVFAPSFGWLIVSRIVLGLGTSAAYPSAIALINKKYANAHKAVPGSALGIVAMSGQVSMVFGPVLGGLLTQWLGWRGIFFINIPWVIISVYLSKSIPDYKPAAAKKGISLFKRLDAVGIILFSLFLLSLLFLLIQHEFNWLHIIPVVTLLLLLILWERKQQSPFIDVRLLANKPALSLVYIRFFILCYILYLIMYSMPQWLQGVKDIQPAATGLIMLPNSVMALVFGLLIAKSKNLFTQNLLGTLALLAGCIGLFFINKHVSVFFIVAVSMVMGIAEGISIIANQALLNKEAPAAQKGVSFGLVRTFGYLGAIVSGSQLKVLFHDGITDQRYHVLSYSALFACVLMALLLIPLWLRRSLQSG